jgi:hypothetical protein
MNVHEADNVTLDCHGHTISGWIGVEEDGTTVKDCTVSGKQQPVRV